MKGRKKWLLLILLLLCFGVAYAMLITNLSIGGSGKLSKNEWNIIFENINVMNGSVSGEANIVDDKGISFNANLGKPGDYFEFSVDVSNKGSLDAMVNNYVINKIGNNSNVVLYDIRYVDGMELSKGDRILSKEKDTLLVKVFYRTDISVEELVTEEVDLSYEFNIDYVQDLGKGVDRKVSLNRHLIHDVNTDISKLSFNSQVTGKDSGIYMVRDFYFFRGGIINNNVVVGNSCYYALLADTQGNVKLLYNGDYVDGQCTGVNNSIGRSAYNSDVSNNSYETSEIRTKLLEWYDDNLSIYDDYIVSGFCNETMSINKKKYDGGIVDIECKNTIDDKIGLLTINDVLLVGHGVNGNYRSYLFDNISYYTMSIYSEDKAIMVDQFGTKALANIDSERAVRPVIKIKAHSPIKQGDGSANNPYIMDFKV